MPADLEQMAHDAIAEVEKTLQSHYLQPSQKMYAIACIAENYAEASSEVEVETNASLIQPLQE